MNKSLMLGGLAAAMMMLPVAAFADLAKEISTAQTHAGLAAKATTVDGVHMHLHHALNCLVGPTGMGFDSTQANPCATAGKGIQADAGAGGTGEPATVDAAIAATKTGLADMDLAAAQKDAMAASMAIGKIPAK